MKVVKGGVTAPLGFKASGLYCGIKRSAHKLDLGLIYSEIPAVCAGVFTKNSIKAAPLVVTQQKMKKGAGQAVIVNSGNANCFTGEFGLLYARQSTEEVAKYLKIAPNAVFVSSTGIIGKPLPYHKIEAAVPELVKQLSRAGGKNFAQAILTTDLCIKECAVQIMLGGKKVTVGACGKGSGMIEPNMATMLAFINTDAAISPVMLKSALKEATEVSFNSITVDGCMSTNDMAMVMANGVAGNPIIKTRNADYKKLCEALTHVCLDLSKKIVLDGEGATKFIEITVTGAKTKAQAKAACFKIANSNLVKTAAYGSNPNWGRVAAAIGSFGWNFSEKDLKINFSSFKKKYISIQVELNLGKEQATVYTADLSKEYVRINGEYN